MSVPIPASTYIFDPELDLILTVLLGLDLNGLDNLNIEMFWYQGITSFYHFEVIHPRDFRNYSYLIPSDSITDQQPVPSSIHEDLTDVIYYWQHLTATNHSDRDTPVNWTNANFSLYNDVIFICDDDFICDDENSPLTASEATTAANVLD